MRSGAAIIWALMVVFTSRSYGGLDAAGAPARVRLLASNEESWVVRYRLLRQAKHSILASYYIIVADGHGEAFLWMLMQKAREGVDVKLMLDARGSARLPRTFLGKDVLQEVAAAGVEEGKGGKGSVRT